MTTNEIQDIIIVGGGTAGLSAALYALRAGCSLILIEEYVQGGQIITSNEVENFPALPKVTGVEFAMALFAQVEQMGLNIKYEKIESIDLAAPIKTVITNKATYQAKTVILATGTTRRKLEVPGEEKLGGRGVSFCATCDGAFHKGKAVAVAGGGNTALEDALFLAQTCSQVYLIHRRAEFKGEQILLNKAEQTANIEILRESEISRIDGEQRVERITVRSRTDGSERELAVSGVFVAVGIMPNNRLYKDVLELDEAGFVKADESCHTNLPGVFVAGDSRAKLLRQLITAAADGAVAATEANKYILEQ